VVGVVWVWWWVWPRSTDVRTDLLCLVERHQETEVLNGVGHGYSDSFFRIECRSRRRVGGDRYGIPLGPCSMQCAGFGVV